jgi:hypothetical protein
LLRNSCLSGIKIFIIFLVLILLASSSATADFSQRDWRYVKDIILPPGLQPNGLVELTPDREVFASAAQGLADLRIISNEQNETPYKLEISKAESERTSFSVSIRDKGYVPGSYDIFTADLGKVGILHNEIEFRTPATNFRRTAIVETSNDEATWMKIAEQTVYAFTVKEQNFTTRDTRIRYPESTARYLRVKIADNGEGPLEITGATIFFVKETPAQEIPWPSSILNISRDTGQRTTNVEVDLGTQGLPSYRLAISVPDFNFYREVTLQAGTNRESWTTLMRRAEIYAYDTPKFVGKSLVITYPETTARYLRLVIHDEDSPPLTIEEVNVWGLWRRVVFAADPQQSYNLYYGNTEAHRPSYDIEKVFPYLVTEKLLEAKLGSQATNPDFVEKKPPVSERFPWLFPTVVAVAVIVVALLLLGILRQARKVLPPPKE